MSGWIWAAIVLAAGFVLLYFNTAWVGIFDRARRNRRDAVEPEYERPRYWAAAPGGVYADVRRRWHGWDGWYFFLIPDDRSLPVEMIRGSLMTGLYGLEGIDNLERLLLRLDSRDAVEHLLLTPTRQHVGAELRLENNLFQAYLPKATDLRMKVHELDTAVSAVDPVNDDTKIPYGRVHGTWPDYRLEFENPEAGIHVDLRYRGSRLVWWADLPSIFTYFAAFGKFEGTITYRFGTAKGSAYDLTGPAQSFSITGRGAFEHGFARKPFDFDPLFLPFRLLRTLIRFRAISYHYELFLDDSGIEGGVMRATGFGIVFRNHGGVHDGMAFAQVNNVRIRYEPASAERVLTTNGRSAVLFYRRWRVEADTAGGPLAYEAEREFPAAPVAEGMIYYHFRYRGTFGGRPIVGRGYGEYVSL